MLDRCAKMVLSNVNLKFIITDGHQKRLIYKDLSLLIDDFGFDSYSKSATNYDLDEVVIINYKLLQQLSYNDLKSKIDLIDDRIDEKFLKL